MKRKPFVPDPVMGRVVSIGFFYSSKGPKKDVFRLELDMRDMPDVERRKLINQFTKLMEITGGKP
jgi:hypothetical protein